MASAPCSINIRPDLVDFLPVIVGFLAEKTKSALLIHTVEGFQQIVVADFLEVLRSSGNNKDGLG